LSEVRIHAHLPLTWPLKKKPVPSRIIRHPQRRTGLAGRGVLKRWGPNHEVLVAATRWARDEQGQIKTINGLKVLETLVLDGDGTQVMCPRLYSAPCFAVLASLYVAVIHIIFPLHQYTLPRSERRPHKSLPDIICKELQFSNEDVMFVSRPSKNTTLAEVQQHVVLMSKGIVEDPRDTDNAWVERMSLCMHADEDVFPTLPADAQLCWVQVSRELDLPSTEVELLQEVAVAYGAYFADQVRAPLPSKTRAQ
jgi:hypothetical protein